MIKGHSAPEAALAKELRSLLEHRGWRAVRMESGFVPGAGSFGEKGMADWLYLRYLDAGTCLSLWIETKPPGHKPRCNCRPAARNPETGRMQKAHECRSCGQKRWAETERRRGAIVITVDDVDEFERWYEERFGWLPAAPQPQGELFA